jgi:hypothetical protein
MECWVNSAKSITPILQHSNSPMKIGSYLEESKIHHKFEFWIHELNT